MNRKIITSLIAVTILCSTSFTAMAAPTSEQQQIIQENRDKYADVNNKINDLTSKIDELDVQIQPIVLDIQSNDEKINKVKSEITSTEKEIDQSKAELAKKEEVFGDRMRAIYKTGGQENYLAILLSSKSVSDFLTKFQAVGKIMSMDKQVIDEIFQKKEQLDNKVKELSDKNKELENLNAENQKKLDELNIKKDEQQKFVDQLKEERSQISVDLTESERSLIEYAVSIINNNSSSIEDLQNAISMIKKVRTSLVSTEVDNEAQAAIDKAVKRIDDLKAAAAAAATASRPSTPNRGNGGSSSPSLGSAPASASATAILNYAYNFLGRPYLLGATGPDKFDCSGFTSYVFGHFGISVGGRTTWEQRYAGTSVSKGNLQPGDLVFTNGYGHVGIYVGNGQMIHAPRTGDVVKVGPVYGFVEGRRVL